jgi:hypothetical protein
MAGLTMAVLATATLTMTHVQKASYKQLLRNLQTPSSLLLLTLAALTMSGAARPPDDLRAARAAEPAAGGVRRAALWEAADSAGGRAATRAPPPGHHRERGRPGGLWRRLGAGTVACACVDGLGGHGIPAQGVRRSPAGRV